MDTPCLVIRQISRLIAVKNDSGLLLDLSILNDSSPMAKYAILDGTLFDLSRILTIETGNESLFYQRGQNEKTFNPLF